MKILVTYQSMLRIGTCRVNSQLSSKFNIKVNTSLRRVVGSEPLLPNDCTQNSVLEARFACIIPFCSNGINPIQDLGQGTRDTT